MLGRRRLSKNAACLSRLGSGILPVSSQQSALQARALPEGEPSKTLGCCRASQRTGGRPVTAGHV